MTDESIRTEFVDTGDMRFEVDVCGDPHSHKLALLLHGFPEHAFSWRYQLPLFARLGYKAWAPNQRGYGKTSRPRRVRDYRLDHLVDDVASLIDASGCSSVTLVGHDWGGAVAWAAALVRARPIERLMVMNLPHPTRFAEGLRTLKQLRRSWYIFAFQIPRLAEYVLGRDDAKAVGDMFHAVAVDKSRFPDEVLEVFRHNARQPGALTAMLNWYRAMLRPGASYVKDVLESPPILDTPTLMVWGERDPALGKELTYGTERLVRDLTIRYLPGVSHWVQQEAPEAVNTIVEAWLGGRSIPEFEHVGVTALTGRGALGPSEQQLNVLTQGDTQERLGMLELIRYGERGSRRSYRAHLEARGAKIVWGGRADLVFVGADLRQWDDLLIVEYRSREAYFDAVANGNRAAAAPPAEALEILACRPWPPVGRALVRGYQRFLEWRSGPPDVPAQAPGLETPDSPKLEQAALGPGTEQLRALVEGDRTSKLVLCNLLAYRSRAEYPPATRAEPTSGEHAYRRRYGRPAAKLIGQLGGRILWVAQPSQVLVGKPADWHAVAVVEYPSRAAFLAMIQSPEYRTLIPHRDAGLARTEVIACTPWTEFT